ncbi:hypothetical protein ASZ90_015941 [hydrocarbon metagenome]|uniref:Uncharacterized protein n=1 Tax=hydrocarbon metagenome TaxID=938273 RepID=A0A0W8F0R0_9ZZZZ
MVTSQEVFKDRSRPDRQVAVVHYQKRWRAGLPAEVIVRRKTRLFLD